MRAALGAFLGLTLVAVFGVLLYSSQQASVASNESERACLAALQNELGLASDAGLRTASWRDDGERVTAEWRYGSMRAGSGVMPVGRGEVGCSISDGEVASIHIEKYAGTP